MTRREWLAMIVLAMILLLCAVVAVLDAGPASYGGWPEEIARQEGE